MFQRSYLQVFQLQACRQLVVDENPHVFPHFRYVTVDGRTDNCLLSSVSTPVSNVGYIFSYMDPIHLNLRISSKFTKDIERWH